MFHLQLPVHMPCFWNLTGRKFRSCFPGLWSGIHISQNVLYVLAKCESTQVTDKQTPMFTRRRKEGNLICIKTKQFPKAEHFGFSTTTSKNTSPSKKQCLSTYANEEQPLFCNRREQNVFSFSESTSMASESTITTDSITGSTESITSTERGIFGPGRWRKRKPGSVQGLQNFFLFLFHLLSVCPVGFGSVACIACTKGFFKAVTGETDCSKCPLSFYQPNSGTYTPLSCLIFVKVSTKYDAAIRGCVNDCAVHIRRSEQLPFLSREYVHREQRFSGAGWLQWVFLKTEFSSGGILATLMRLR